MIKPERAAKSRSTSLSASGLRRRYPVVLEPEYYIPRCRHSRGFLPIPNTRQALRHQHLVPIRSAVRDKTVHFHERNAEEVSASR